LITGSAIALLLSGRFAGWGLDGIADVFLDDFELGEQAVGIGRIDAFQRGRGQFGAQPCELGEQRARGLAQIETVDAAVVVVAAALDPAIVAELVDQPRQRDRLHLHLLGEFRLLQAFLAFYLGQHGPLRAGDAVTRSLLVGVDPDPANKDRITDWAKSYWEALHPYGAGGAYINFMMDGEGDERIRATYRENYDRLATTKAKYDPKNFFRVNQNIRPAGKL